MTSAAGRVWGEPLYSRTEKLLEVRGARLWHRGGATELPCDVVVTGPKAKIGCFWPATATVDLPDGTRVEVPGTIGTFGPAPGDRGYGFCPTPGHPALLGLDL